MNWTTSTSEMLFIKLTIPNGDIWVAVKRIIALKAEAITEDSDEEDAWTQVILEGADDPVLVREIPEEIIQRLLDHEVANEHR